MIGTSNSVVADVIRESAKFVAFAIDKMGDWYSLHIEHQHRIYNHAQVEGIEVDMPANVKDHNLRYLRDGRYDKK